MRLSEAIRLGSLAIQNPRPRDTRFCAIGMGLESIGKRFMGRDGSEYDAINYCELRRQWPWVNQYTTVGDYVASIYGIFDWQVIPGKMTLEALCDQVRMWENALEAKGINVEQVTMAATPETTSDPAAEHTKELELISASR